MKKLVMSILTILTCGAAYALPVGNPSEASLFTNGLWFGGPNGCCDVCDPCFSWCDAWNFRVGYYGDFVFDRHLKSGNSENDEDDGTGSGKALENARLHTNAAYLVLNFCNRVDIFATLGETKCNTRQNTSLFFPTSIDGAEDLRGFESNLFWRSAFSWSIGGRATLWQCDCFSLGVEGQYFRTNPRLDHAVLWGPIFNGAKLYFDNDDFRSRIREWQVGLGVSYRIATSCPTLAFVPYAAVKYSRHRWTTNQSFPFLNTSEEEIQEARIPDFHSHKRWGWALGLTFTLCDVAGITAEGRWGDERALYINGQIRF